MWYTAHSCNQHNCPWHTLIVSLFLPSTEGAYPFIALFHPRLRDSVGVRLFSYSNSFFPYSLSLTAFEMSNLSSISIPWVGGFQPAGTLIIMKSCMPRTVEYTRRLVHSLWSTPLSVLQSMLWEYTAMTAQCICHSISQVSEAMAALISIFELQVCICSFLSWLSTEVCDKVANTMISSGKWAIGKNNVIWLRVMLIDFIYLKVSEPDIQLQHSLPSWMMTG